MELYEKLSNFNFINRNPEKSSSLQAIAPILLTDNEIDLFNYIIINFKFLILKSNSFFIVYFNKEFYVINMHNDINLVTHSLMYSILKCFEKDKVIYSEILRVNLYEPYYYDSDEEKQKQLEQDFIIEELKSIIEAQKLIGI
jgi:hypothetical protein